MASYLARRVAAFIPALWAAASLIFILLRLTPGDPAQSLFAEAWLTPEQLAARRAALGLDQPLGLQYLRYLGGLLRGDLGDSLFTQQPVAATVAGQLGPTARLAAAGLGAGLGLGLAAGFLLAWRPRGAGAAAARWLTAFSLAAPVAWTGLIMLWLAARLLGRTAAGLSSLVLPALVLGISTAGPLARVAAASLSQVRDQPFMVAARARGIRGLALSWHALRVALIPIVQLAALQAAFLFGGTVVTETVFSRPGLGRLLVDSLLRQDYAVVQGVSLLVAGLYLVFNLLADLLAALLDPRLRPAPEGQ